MKAEIISDMLKPVCWKAFCVTAFLLIFQRTLSLTVEFNLAGNTGTIAVPQVTGRKTFSVMQLIQTRDA